MLLSFASLEPIVLTMMQRTDIAHNRDAMVEVVDLTVDDT